MLGLKLKDIKYAVVLICILLISQLCYAQSPTSATLQTAASTGDGTALNVTGYSGLTLSILGTAGSDRVVTFQASSDGTNYSSISCTNVSTLALSTTITTSGTTLVQVRCNVVGFRLFKAPLSGGTTGTVTITALGLAQVSVIYPPTTGAGSGDALVANPLSQFAPTTSAQLASTITDETGSGAVAFGTTPTFTTSAILGSGDGGTPVNFSALGPVAVGTNIAGGTITLKSGVGTGTGSVGRFVFQVATSKITTGTTAHIPVNVLILGASQSAHPGANGFVTASPTTTVTDENTAASGTAALDIAHSFTGKAFNARNTLVTTTDVTTMYITDSAGGTNNTATNVWSLITGRTKFLSAAFAPSLTVASGVPSSLCINAVTGEIVSNAALTCTVSSRNQKRHISNLKESGIRIINKLRPTSFEYKDQLKRTRWGFIAEELAQVNLSLADGYRKNQPTSIDQNALLAIAIKAIQEQQGQIVELTRRLELLEKH